MFSADIPTNSLTKHNGNFIRNMHIYSSYLSPDYKVNIQDKFNNGQISSAPSLD